MLKDYHSIPFFFTQALSDSYSQTSEWQQVSWPFLIILANSNIDISMYGLNSSIDLKFSSFLFQNFGNCSKRVNYNWYLRYSHISHFLKFFSMVLELVSLYIFIDFYSVVRQAGNVHYSAGSIFFVYHH